MRPLTRCTLLLSLLALCCAPALDAQSFTITGPSTATVGDTLRFTASATAIDGDRVRSPAIVAAPLTPGLRYLSRYRYVATDTGAQSIVFLWNRSDTPLPKVHRVTVAPRPTPARFVGAAELPRATVDVQVPRVTGRSYRVATATELRAALTAVRGGDEIVLEAGKRFVGAFTLPARGDSGWVVIRSSGVLPPAGVRAQPRDVAAMATVSTPGSNQPAFVTSGASRGWHFLGFEVTAEPGAYVGALVSVAGHTASTMDAMPGRFTFDRMVMHPQPGQDVRRCILGNGAAIAVVDSWLERCHHAGADAQAFLAWNGPGPYLLRNNYLEASGEVVLFGGADSRAAALLPQDITITRNHFTRPVEWRSPKRFLVKNLLELKVGIRVDVQGNVFENNWPDGQTGFAILFKSVDQEGSAPWSETRDVVVRCNLIRRTSAVFSLAGKPEAHPAIPASRITLEHNLVSEAPPLDWGGSGHFLLLQGVADVTVRHNTTSTGVTTYRPHSAAYIVNGNSPRLTMTGNVWPLTQYGIFSDNGGGTRALDNRAPGWTFTGNLLPGVAASSYPTGNSYPSSAPATLPVGVGADSARVAACTTGVVVPP